MPFSVSFKLYFLTFSHSSLQGAVVVVPEGVEDEEVVVLEEDEVGRLVAEVEEVAEDPLVGVVEEEEVEALVVDEVEVVGVGASVVDAEEEEGGSDFKPTYLGRVISHPRFFMILSCLS
jgi:hypothetical protein